MTDHLIWAAGLVAHLVLLYALFKGKAAAELPSFTLLILFYLVRSVTLAAVQRIVHHPASLFITLVLDLVDVLLQCAVLAELTWLALKPLPRQRRFTLPLLLAISGILIVVRLAPHHKLALPTVLVLAHFWLSVLMVEWAIMLAFLLRPMQGSWRSPVAAVSLGFGIYSAVLLSGGGYFTTGRGMRDYIFFSYFRVAVYLVVVLLWAISFWQANRRVA